MRAVYASIYVHISCTHTDSKLPPLHKSFVQSIDESEACSSARSLEIILKIDLHAALCFRLDLDTSPLLSIHNSSIHIPLISFVIAVVHSQAEPIHSSTTGPDSGLILILNTTKADYLYPLRNTVGFNVHIFNSHEYPDGQTGSFVQLFVTPETEAFFKLDVTTIDAIPAVLQYSAEQRGCRFNHELDEQYGGYYSFADCLLKCKIKSIMALCDCMPFTLPTNFPDGTTSKVKCTLAHNRCLHRYKGEHCEGCLCVVVV